MDSWAQEKKKTIGKCKIQFTPQTPQKIGGALADIEIKKALCGTNHVVALSKEGHVYTWGFGGYGRLGHKVQKDEYLPKKIQLNNFYPVSNIAVGDKFNLAVGSNDVLYTWGKTKASGDSMMYPTLEKGLEGWKIGKMSCGFASLIVIGDTNKTIGWGNCTTGELGFGENQKSSSQPKVIDPLNEIKVIEIACGYSHTLFLVEISDKTKKLKTLEITKKEKSGSASDSSDSEESVIVNCGICTKTTNIEDDTILICDGCDGEFHLKCTGINAVPEGDWFCNTCQAPKKKRKINK